MGWFTISIVFEHYRAFLLSLHLTVLYNHFYFSVTLQLRYNLLLYYQLL
jgi:hypothetical protein